MESNSVILVLTDKRTAFAAEGFVSLLRNMPNVIVVGSNTAGVNLCGEVKTVYLPHSGAGVQFGTALAFRETLENVEGTGIEPDVWVPPEDALERTLTFLSTYKN